MFTGFGYILNQNIFGILIKKEQMWDKGTL